MKGKLRLGIGFLSLFFCLMFGSNVQATEYKIKLGTTINSDNTIYAGKSELKSAASVWHYSGGYWKLGIHGTAYSEPIYDYEVGSYFTGTSRLLPEQTWAMDVPQNIKDYARKYGQDAVGLKVTSANPESINFQNVKVNWGGDFLHVTFVPKMGYETYNYWQRLNNGVYNQMSDKAKNIFVPRVREGYGSNRLSVEGGDKSIRLNDGVAGSAYKSGSVLKFNSTEVITKYIGTGTDPAITSTRACDTYSEASFFSGGNNGVFFEFPITVEFYIKKHDAPYWISTEVHDSPYMTAKPVTGKLYDTERTYWFKNNQDFSYSITTGSDLVDLWKVNTAVKEASTWDYWFNGGDESKVGPYVQRYVTGKGLIHQNTFCVDGNERRKVTKYTFQADKDIDIAICADAINRESQWMVGLDKNPKSEAVDAGYRIKTDGGHPLYDSLSIKERTDSKVVVSLKGVYDTRSGIRYVAFPTWVDGQDADWKCYFLHEPNDPNNNIQLVRTYTEDGYTKYDFEYTIYYKDWPDPNNIYCHVYMYDNVMNYFGDPSLDLKVKTRIKDVSVSGANYKNVNGSYVDHWFNGSTNTDVIVSSESPLSSKERWMRLYTTNNLSSHVYSRNILSSNDPYDKNSAIDSVSTTKVVDAHNSLGYNWVDKFTFKGTKEYDYFPAGLVKDSNNNYSDTFINKTDRIRYDLTKPVATCNTNTGLVQHGTEVKFTLTDSRSGVKNYRYRIYKDSNAFNWSNWINGTSFGVPLNDGDAEYYIEVEVQDNVLNKTSYSGTKKFGPFIVDRQAPSSSVTQISGQNYKNGNDYWYKGGSTATIMTTTTDNVTGSSLIELSLDNSTRKGLTASFVDSKYDLVQSQTINSTYVKSFTTEYVFEGTPRKRNITWKPVFTTAEVDYPVTIRARDYANNISGWTGNMLNAVIRIDSTAPTATGWSVTNITPFNFTFKVDGVNDTRSGVKEVAVKITPKSDTSKSKTYKFNQSGNISKQLALTEFSNIYGDYVMDITITDNVGYTKTYNGYTFNVPRPVPKNDLWEFRNANYIEGNNYWVKPTTKWTIRHRGYFPSNWGVHPTETRTMFTLQSDNSVSTVGARTNYGHTSSNLGNKFSSSDLSGTLTQSVSNGRNIAEGVYGTKAIRDGDKFKMSYTTVFNYNSTEFKEIKDSGKYLCVDGKAPTGNVSGSGDGDTIKVNLTSVSDNGGSGVKSVTAKIVNVDNASQVSTVNLTSSGNNSYNATINNVLSLLPGATTVRVDFTLTDNVGNTRTVSSKNFSMFKLTARLYPKVDPSSTDDCPTMMAGQVGVISSKIWGNANKIEYQFQSLGSLNTSKNLTPQSVVTVDHEFQIPLNTQPGTYNVTVIATRPDGLKKQVNLSFKVQGSITDDLRTHTIYGDK